MGVEGGGLAAGKSSPPLVLPRHEMVAGATATIATPFGSAVVGHIKSDLESPRELDRGRPRRRRGEAFFTTVQAPSAARHNKVIKARVPR